MPASDVIPYMIAQVVGGILGALVLYIIASGAAAGAPANLAANGWDPVAGYSTFAALITEIVATFIFVTVILGVTNAKHTTMLAGLGIGLTLAALHFCFIPVSGQFAEPGPLDRPGAVFGRCGDRPALALHRGAVDRRRTGGHRRQGGHTREGLSLFAQPTPLACGQRRRRSRPDRRECRGDAGKRRLITVRP